MEANTRFGDVSSPGRGAFAFLASIALLGFGGLFLYVGIQHVLYPGFVETTEGDALQQIERIASGLSPYPKPGAEFVSLAYTPLYFFMAAPLYRVWGDAFTGPRLLSLTSAAAAGGLLAWIAWRESRSRVAAALAAALYFAGYALMDAYLTCALPDALLLFWLLLGYCFLGYGTTRLHDIAWLASFGLAFWTKQHGAFFFGFALLYALLFRRNALPRWAIVAAFLVLVPVAYVALGPALGEGFFYQTFVVPGRWEHKTIYAVRRVTFLLFAFVPFSVLLTLRWLRASNFLRDARHGRVAPLAWFTLSTLVATTATMTAAGSSNNHFIPLVAILASTAALGARSLFGSDITRDLSVEVGLMALGATAVSAAAQYAFRDHVVSPVPPVSLGLSLAGCLWLRRSRPPWAGVGAATLLVLGQLAVSAYNPADFLPDPAFRSGLARLRQAIGGLDGKLYWLPHGDVPAALTGMKIARAPSWVVLDDVDRQEGVPGEALRVLAPFRESVLTGPTTFILCDAHLSAVPYWRVLADHYVLTRDFGADFSAVRQIGIHWYSGRSYPRYLYQRVASAELPPR